MRSFSKVVFDEYLVSLTPVYSKVQDLESFGGRQLGVMVVATNINDPLGKGVTLTVAIEHSGDGVYFLDKASSPLINSVLAEPKSVISAGESLVASPGVTPTVYLPPTPSLPYVRLRVSVTDAARIKITLSVRGSHRAAEAEPTGVSAHVASRPGSLVRHEAMMREVHDLSRRGAALPAAQRANFLVQGLSHESREHLEAVDRHLGSLPADVRRDIRSHTVSMVQRAMAHAARHGATGLRQAPKDCCEGDEPQAPGISGKVGGCGCG